MKVKRKDLVELWQMINHYRQQKYGVKVSYFLARNRKNIQPEIEALEEAVKPSEAFKVYDSKRAKLAESYADKDEKGRPVIRDGSYLVQKQKDEFDKDLNIVKEKYQKVVEERNKQVDEYNKMLEEEVDFEGYKINFKDLPPEIESVFIESLMDTGLLADEPK